MADDNDRGIALLLAEARRLCGNGEARAIREAADLSLAELARDVGVSESTLSEWERGAQRPTGQRAIRYLAVLRDLHNATASPAWGRSEIAGSR